MLYQGLHGQADDRELTVETERQEIEELRRQLEREREDFNRKMEWEKERLEREKALFDMKLQVLQVELAKFAEDKKKFLQQKAFFERVKAYEEENRASTATISENNIVRGEMFFIGVQNRDGLRKRYRDLLKIYHPDNAAGDTSTIQEINNEYKKLSIAMEA